MGGRRMGVRVGYGSSATVQVFLFVQNRLRLTPVRSSTSNMRLDLTYRFYGPSGRLGMKQRLQLQRSRLLGFRLSQESDQQASDDVHIGAKIGKVTGGTASRAAQARAYFDARMGAKIGKVPTARAYFDVRIGAKIGKVQPDLR